MKRPKIDVLDRRRKTVEKTLQRTGNVHKAAEALGVSTYILRSYLVTRGIQYRKIGVDRFEFSDRDVVKLLKLRRDGADIAEIAQKFKVGESAAYNALRRWKIRDPINTVYWYIATFDHRHGKGSFSKMINLVMELGGATDVAKLLGKVSKERSRQILEEIASFDDYVKGGKKRVKTQ